MVTTAAPRPQTEQEQAALIRKHREHCEKRIEEDPGILPGNNVSCPPVWDEIMCWERTPAGHLAVQRCPGYFAGFIEQANASRRCLENGSWYFNPQYNKQWTNYTQCYLGPETTILINSDVGSNNTSLEKYVPTLKVISEVGYSVSLVSLVAAFLILACIKRLHCPRNVLHMHLFASFILRAFMSLLKDTLFVMGLGLSADVVRLNDGDYFNSQHDSNWPCRLITTMWQYFIMANYSWILMEGLYLHNLIFLALFSDSSSIKLYIALGWGLPGLFMIPWAICRALLDNLWCWTTNDDKLIFMLIQVPITASIVVNFILFVNIVRVLLLKLKSSVCEETKTYRRWAKSTLVLVPLFGVHYMIFLALQLGVDTIVEVTWLFCNQLFASFNGFFVAVLYCFMNGEVRTELAKRRVRWSPGALGCAGLPLSLPCAARSRRSSSGGASGARSGAPPAEGRPPDDADAAPNGSCYSSTAFTSVSMLPATHCCNPGRKRGSSQAQVKLEAHPPVGEVREKSPKSKDRRWSVSDCDLEKNALELRCMTSPNNLCVKL